eukprot:UN13619
MVLFYRPWTLAKMKLAIIWIYMSGIPWIPHLHFGMGSYIWSHACSSV